MRVSSGRSNEKIRECSRKRPTIETTRMFSEMPGTPGRSAQMPLTLRSTSHARLRGPVERLDAGRVEQRVHLHPIRAGSLGRVRLDRPLDLADDPVLAG